MDERDENNFPKPAPMDEAALKARRRRNVWLGLTLFGFVILIVVITALRMKANLGAG